MRVLLVIACVALAGCGTFGGDRRALETKGPTVADVVKKLPELAMPEVRAEAPTRDDVMAAYRRVYGELPSATENHQVGKRLADLEMQVGEERNIDGANDPYAAAIALYESLLDEAPAEERGEILYQLARANDVVGAGPDARRHLDRLIEDHPDSQHRVEARFRRAEMSFSKEDFRAATPDYAYVVREGEGSAFWLNAAYMLGWCQFKESQLDASLATFFRVVAAALGDTDAENVPETGRELLDDTLRVVVLALAYLDGAETLAVHMNDLGLPAWQHLVYERLANDFREKERWLDSVATYETFIEHNPVDLRAPVFHQRAIDTLIAADFPSEVRPRKESFVARYGYRSAFWQVHGVEGAADYLPTLKTYLNELSKLAHAEAQERKSKADYLKAADWYEQIVETFPKDPDVAEHLFLLGEVYTEAQEHERAVAAYQRVVREFPAFPRANEAGYAAILALGALVESVDARDRELWERSRIDAQIEFAMLFPDDARAARVQADAADALFAQARYQEAVELAEHLVQHRPGLSGDLARTTLSVIGHGRFELGAFAAAETAYRSLAAIAPAPEISERLLASIYKQAETAEATGDTAGAVSHFLRIRDEAPGSELAVKGQYDAIALVEAQGDLEQAADLLADLRNRAPEHALTRGAERRLADLYERAEAPGLAADEYRRVAAADGDSEVRRQALYRAAELYLQTGQLDDAVAGFRDYADTYREPAELRLEAIHHLDELAQQRGDTAARRRWLQEKIALADARGNSATDRMKFLAADAQFLFSGEARADYEAVSLGHPLEASLVRKRKALTAAIDAYEKAASYGVQQLATSATFHIAEIYSGLSRALLASERPKGLSELELEQYEILLEEQAFPFEEKAIAIHELNLRRSWDGVFDEWVQKSFAALRMLMPGRFDKREMQVGYVETIY